MASNTVRGKGSAAPSGETPLRPPIWTEGRQPLTFGLAAWARVATAMAARDLVPAIDDATGRLTRLADRVGRGDLRVTAAWGKRILPSHQNVGRAIAALERSLTAARTLLAAPELLLKPLAYPNLDLHLSDCPAIPPSPKPEKLEPTLHAIRSAIGTPAHANPYAPTPPMPLADNARQSRTGAITAHGVLAVLMLFAWPRGAVKAMLYHLDGGDLRDWS